MIKIKKSYLEDVRFNARHSDEDMRNYIFPLFVQQQWNPNSHLSDQKQLDELFWKFANEVAQDNDHWEIHQKDEKNCPVCKDHKKRYEAIKKINEVLNRGKENDCK